MKTDLEVIDDYVQISTQDGNLIIAIDIGTGTVLDIQQVNVTVNQLNTFIGRAKSRYNKFLTSKAVESFIE